MLLRSKGNIPYSVCQQVVTSLNTTISLIVDSAVHIISGVSRILDHEDRKQIVDEITPQLVKIKKKGFCKQ